MRRELRVDAQQAIGWGVAEVRSFFAEAELGQAFFALSVKTLRGGYWNEVLRVDTRSGPLVVKRYAQVMPGSLFPNLPDAEAMALERMAGLDVAPEGIGYWPQHKVLIYRYVAGDLWQGDLEAVARLLRRKLAVDVTGFRAVPVTVPDVLAQGDMMFAKCRLDVAAAECLAARPDGRECGGPDRVVLIHTDIGAGNLVGAGDGLRLIDWQCPAAGDLAEDVFSFLAPSFQILNHRPTLAASQRDAFLEALDMPRITARLGVIEPAFAYRMAAYCCRRMQTAAEASVRDLYARAVAAELARLQAWQ